MKERPILMSAPMVRSILAGTKTQTRRAVRYADPELIDADGWPLRDESFNGAGEIRAACPYGAPGDRLRVKEAAWMWCERRPNGKTPAGRDKWLYVPMREAGLFYAADHPQRPTISVVSPDTGNQWGWRLKIGRFLPAWASRILLEVTGRRVERLQSISVADAMAEGVVETNPNLRGLEPCMEWRYAYEDLWNQLHGTGSWDANPFVWVVEFKRIEEARAK